MEIDKNRYKSFTSIPFGGPIGMSMSLTWWPCFQTQIRITYGYVKTARAISQHST